MNIETASSGASFAAWAHRGKREEYSAGRLECVQEQPFQAPEYQRNEGIWLTPQTMLMMEQLQLANELRDLRFLYPQSTSTGVCHDDHEDETRTSRKGDHNAMLAVAELPDLIQLASINCNTQDSSKLQDLIRFESDGIACLGSKADMPDLIQLDSVDGNMSRMSSLEQLHLLDSPVTTPAHKCVFSVELPAGEFLWPVQVDAAATEGSLQPATPESMFLDSLNCVSEDDFTTEICQEFNFASDQATLRSIPAIDNIESQAHASGIEPSAPCLTPDITFQADAILEADASLNVDADHEADANLESDEVLEAGASLEADAGPETDAVLQGEAGLVEAISVVAEACSTKPSDLVPEAWHPCSTSTTSELEAGFALRLYRQDHAPTEPEKSAPTHVIPLQKAGGGQRRQEGAGAKFVRAVQQTLETVRQAMASGKVPAWGSLGLPLHSTGTDVVEMVSLMAAEADR